MATKFLNLSTDTTLGGVSPSDEIAVSQKAIKTYVDNQGGGGSSTLAGLSDVTLTSPTDGQVLTYDNGTWINAESAGGYHPDLFTWQWADHKLNDVQWLRADTFSWQSGAVYQAAYAHLVLDIDGKTLQSETISGTTIQFYLADDGHKICPASEESNVTAIYNATGVAWYYIIDTTNQRFKLPRAKHNKYTESLSVIGTGKVLGLTNGTDTFALNSGATYARLTIGYNAGQNVASSGGYDAGYNVNWRIGVSKDPAYSGLTTTSIEQDTDQYKYLYFYVGNFTQTALENTAGLNAELFAGKIDLDGNNAAFAHIVETYNNGNSWYRVYSDGWCEQGGLSNGGGGSFVTTTFLKPFVDTSYNIVTALLNDENNSTCFGVKISNRTASSFQSRTWYGSGNAGNYNFNWRASGYIA